MAKLTNPKYDVGQRVEIRSTIDSSRVQYPRVTWVVDSIMSNRDKNGPYWLYNLKGTWSQSVVRPGRRRGRLYTGETFRQLRASRLRACT